MQSPSHAGATAALLASDEPAPFTVERPDGRGLFVLTCDHASNRVPRVLEDLGVSDEARNDHIGWDPGALALARALSASLDAPLVYSGYSRLVIDCNRPIDVESAMPRVSCGVPIKGNESLGDAQRTARVEALHRPYHQAIARVLDARAHARHATALIAVHSFTPVMNGVARPWVAGMVYGSDRRLAGALLTALAREEPALVLGDNQPYQVTPRGDYTIPTHGEARGIPHVLLEIRNDQLRDAASIERWRGRLDRALRACAEGLFAPETR